MELDKSRILYVVGDDGISEHTINGLVRIGNANHNNLDHLKVFTEREEAEAEEEAMSKRRWIAKMFERDSLINAHTVQLLDEEGNVLEENRL